MTISKSKNSGHQASKYPLPKSELRTQALAKRGTLSPVLREQHSLEIEKKLRTYLKKSMFDNHHLLAYRSLPEEVDTTALFTAPDSPIYAPRICGDHDMQWLAITKHTTWRAGSFGILEPESGSDWLEDSSVKTGSPILLCPLAAFDRSGNRLGMGRGYFDRWLEKFQCRITTIIGLAFSCQELSSIPAETHDIPLHTIITEKEIIPCQRA